MLDDEGRRKDAKRMALAVAKRARTSMVKAKDKRDQAQRDINKFESLISNCHRQIREAMGKANALKKKSDLYASKMREADSERRRWQKIFTAKKNEYKSAMRHVKARR